MNSLGNRHVGNNVRVLLINNSLGAEFHLFKQMNSIYANNIEKYLSAGGHFGNQSPQVLRHLAEDWGYEYMTASGKDEFNAVIDRFLCCEITDSPMVLELFTDTTSETTALKMMEELVIDSSVLLKNKAKDAVTSVVGEKGKRFIKSILNK